MIRRVHIELNSIEDRLQEDLSEIAIFREREEKSETQAKMTITAMLQRVGNPTSFNEIVPACSKSTKTFRSDLNYEKKLISTTTQSYQQKRWKYPLLSIALNK